jgi:hypothetical protein
VASKTRGAFRALGSALKEGGVADALRRRDGLALQRQNGELEARIERLEELLESLTSPSQIIHSWGVVTSNSFGGVSLIVGYNVADVRLEPVQGRFEIYFERPLASNEWAGFTAWQRNSAFWGYFGAESASGFRLTPASATAAGAVNVNVATTVCDLSFAIVGDKPS